MFSDLPPKADIDRRDGYGRFVPKRAQCTAAHSIVYSITSSAHNWQFNADGIGLAPSNASQTALRFKHAKRAHCDLGGIVAGPAQSFRRISMTNTRSGKFVLFSAVC